MKKVMTLIEILDVPELRSLVDQIEELAGETESELVRIRTELITELKLTTGYSYSLYIVTGIKRPALFAGLFCFCNIIFDFD